MASPRSEPLVQHAGVDGLHGGCNAPCAGPVPPTGRCRRGRQAGESTRRLDFELAYVTPLMTLRDRRQAREDATVAART